MKKLLALLLAVLMLASMIACSEEEDPNDSTVINIGVEKMTYTDEATGDTFTYEYLNSTSVAITEFSSSDYEPHVVTVPETILVITEKKGSDTKTEMEMEVAAIADRAFYAKSNISEIKLSDKITSIGDYAFACCEVLDNVVLPASVTEIGEGAFYSCYNLKNITLNNGLTSIGNNAFYYCTTLESVTFPASVEEIGISAFSDCTTLTEIKLVEGLKSIGKFAFYNCTAVTTVTIPASVEEIGLYAFSTQLRGIEVETEEEGVFETIDVVFNTVEGSYAAEYIANPPSASDIEE